MRAGIQQREDLVLAQGILIRAIGPSFVLFERMQLAKRPMAFPFLEILLHHSTRIIPVL